MKTGPGRFARVPGTLAAALAACALAAPAAGAGDREAAEALSHPFAGALPAPRLVLEGLPPDDAIAPAEAARAGPTSPPEEGLLAPPAAPERRFARAAGQTALMEALPWSVSRYISKSKFSFISIDSVRRNLETGFTYDRDNFSTDQFSHPYHGNLFFNAARSNGYSFWESGAFAFFGSFVWEIGMETEPPALNDLVNTTLGGMERGEIAHRLGTLIRDETARGRSRFWRELGAAVLDPMGAFTRLLDGDLARVRQNPPDRLPSRFVVDLAAFYRDRSSALAGSDGSGQGGIEVRVRYGDPFDGERHRPYEYFDVVLDVTHPSTSAISNVESRGVLVDGPLGAGEGTRQRLALWLRYIYYDNGPISFGGESFDLSHLALVPLPGGTELRTEAGVSVFPLAALAVDYKGVANVVYGRGFDYGPVAAVQAAARFRRREIDLVRVAWALLWQSTLDGVSRGSRVQTLTVEARVPFRGDRFSAGAGWTWMNRATTYDVLPGVEKTGSAVRLFAAATFR